MRTISRLVEKRARHIVEEIDRSRLRVSYSLIMTSSNSEVDESVPYQFRDCTRFLPRTGRNGRNSLGSAGCYGARLTRCGFWRLHGQLVAQDAVVTFSRELRRVQRKTGLKLKSISVMPQMGRTDGSNDWFISPPVKSERRFYKNSGTDGIAPSSIS